MLRRLKYRSGRNWEGKGRQAPPSPPRLLQTFPTVPGALPLPVHFDLPRCLKLEFTSLLVTG